MASQLKVDTITGVTTAGSISVTSEGNSTTTNLQQGLCKAWANFSGGFSLTDDFNIASLTDNGTGRPEFNFTSNMANSTYSAGCHAYNRVVSGYSSDGNFTTTSAAMTTIEPYVGLRDIDSGQIGGVNYFGDLA